MFLSIINIIISLYILALIKKHFSPTQKWLDKKQDKHKIDNGSAHITSPIARLKAQQALNAITND